ncbi:hypothetical protein M404DRAFT_48577, partial [Pisolithus tinctorius Marx 270]
YFDDIIDFCDGFGLSDGLARIKFTLKYAPFESADLWSHLAESSNGDWDYQLSWPEFVVAIARLYPGSRKMDQQYSRNDLYSLVDSRARREICTEEELMNYRLYFLDLATFLWVSKQLEADELEDLYVQGFDKEFRREIIRKMQRDDRRRHSDDPWPMEQVTYTATRLL